MLKTEREEVLQELRQCYEALAACERRWFDSRAPGRWSPPDYITEEINGDVSWYSHRITELEAALTDEAD